MKKKSHNKSLFSAEETKGKIKKGQVKMFDSADKPMKSYRIPVILMASVQVTRGFSAESMFNIEVVIR